MSEVVIGLPPMRFLDPLPIEEGREDPAGPGVKLKAKGIDGQPLWAYRYRLEGRGSARPQVGGFATRGDALKALEKVFTRLGPVGVAATMTLPELVPVPPRGGCSFGP